MTRRGLFGSVVVALSGLFGRARARKPWAAPQVRSWAVLRDASGQVTTVETDPRARGMLVIKSDLPPAELERFKREWQAQMAKVQSSWRVPVFSSEELV
jgi:hypothetical protein